MKDSLKKFIAENREAFDDKQPSESNWKKIESALQLGGGRSLWNSIVLWRSAAVLFLALSIYAFVGNPKELSASEKSASEKKEGLSLQWELSDLESFYSAEIAEKVALIEGFDGANEAEQFTQDYQKLDAMYQVLKEEMKAHPSQKVKDALVLNLLIRIDLLNQQLHKLDNSFKTEKKRKEIST